MFGGMEILVLLIVLPLGLLVLTFWIWMLIDAIQNKGLTDGEKVGWVIAIVLLHWFGALLYCIIARPKKSAPLTT
jgi:Phospholipase_D-nuclease N-terminal